MSSVDLHEGTEKILQRIFIKNTCDWPENTAASTNDFLEDITAQGLAPLLWNQIGGRKGAVGWPHDIQTGLHSRVLHETAAELRLQVELTALLHSFTKAGIRPLLLKGTPLSYTLYPAPGMRPRCDTDILIPESARAKTAEIMERLGYKALHEASVDLINSQMCYGSSQNAGLFNSFDIHWMVSNNDRRFSRLFNYERLAARAVNIPELGPDSWCPGRVDALILACFHRAGHFSHGGDKLIWLYDIHLLSEALSHEEATAFCRTAAELKIVRICTDALCTARSWFGTTLSPPLESLLQQSPEDEFTTVYLQPGRAAGIKNKAVMDLKELSTWRQRLHYLLQNLFPPAQYMLWRYNTGHKTALPLLYLRRLMQGAYLLIKK